MRTYIGIKRCAADEAEPAWIVKRVVPREDYTLVLTFIHGEQKSVDMKPLIAEGKMYAPINDMKLFRKAHIDGPTVAWTPDIDIAPEYLYEHGAPLD